MIIKQDSPFLKSVIDPEKQKQLTPDILSVLIPELEHISILLLKEAKKLMRHSKRSYLKTTDIDLALQ